MRTRWLGWSVVFAGALGCGYFSQSTSSAPSSSSASVADAPSSSRIDGLLDAAWAQKGLTPAPEVDDATFLRRVSIDLLGRIPTSDELRAFQRDTAPDKRGRSVARLLDDPAHARHLARTWDRILLGPEVKNRQVDRGALRRWLEGRFASDAPWDETVRQLVAAEGTTSAGGSRKEAMLDDEPSRGTAESDAGVNGATNFALRYAKSPEDMAGQTSRVFLGVQIQCAQCHDHKTEKWTRDDFRGLSASFLRMRVSPVDKTKQAMAVYEVTSIDKPARRVMKNESTAEIAKFAPRALDGTALAEGDPRKALGVWMTSPENPWFSRAIVNRAWAELMGQGIVDPVDDLRPTNEAVMPEVLDALAEDFEAHHFDLDWLYTAIATSKAYGRALGPRGADPRTALFSHAALRPLASDVLLDSIFVATEVGDRIAEKAPERAEAIKTAVRRKMSFVFDEDAESNAEGYDGTLQQALFTMNGALPAAATAYADGSVLERLLQSNDDDDAIVTELYERTLGRAPTAVELARAKAFLDDPADDAGAPRPRDMKRTEGKKAKKRAGPALPAAAARSTARTPRQRAYEDLFWALLNSSEFSFRK
ncbi:MAG: DUF1549 domain-containing protein [Polyangiaceae bacterium]|nr:DUF1549 domain-containing protein [Polyangiaceae bacterium]